MGVRLLINNIGKKRQQRMKQWWQLMALKHCQMGYSGRVKRELMLTVSLNQ